MQRYSLFSEYDFNEVFDCVDDGDFVKFDDVKDLLETLEGAAYLLRGMTLDPGIHGGAKQALVEKITEIDKVVGECV